MKRLIIISSILLSIIGISVYSIFYTSKLNKDASKLIEHGINACATKDSDRLIENTKKLSELWEHRKRLLSIFIRHDDLETVDIALVNLSAYSQVQEFSFARAELLNLQFTLNQIYKHILPTLENVF